jgi:hypothetical protein
VCQKAYGFEDGHSFGHLESVASRVDYQARCHERINTLRQKLHSYSVFQTLKVIQPISIETMLSCSFSNPVSSPVLVSQLYDISFKHRHLRLQREKLLMLLSQKLHSLPAPTFSYFTTARTNIP